MHTSHKHESLSIPPGVIGVCYTKFQEAVQISRSYNNARYIVEVGDAELVRLCDFKQDYDILLGRPSSAETAKGIEYWVDRIQTGRATNRMLRYPELVVIAQDTSQFYALEGDNNPLIPIGQDASAEITSYMHMAEIIPLD